MEFFVILFWEYVQNLPVLAGLAFAFQLWRQGQFALAVTCLAVGGTAGAVLIALTEARKQAGYREPKAVVLANILGFTILTFLILVYLHAAWSNAWSDVLIGVSGGAGLAILQSLTARKKINWIHCLALGIASPLVLFCIRQLLYAAWPIWAMILSLTALATLVISIVDYLPDELDRIKANKNLGESQ